MRIIHLLCQRCYQYYIDMSLLIVGSCSRVTQNIILSLARSNLYQTITIADLLPLYSFHQRYYKLRKHLNEQRATTQVSLTKLISVQELSRQINAHRDVLHVTHDYFTSVTSKRKLMEVTAQLAKQKQNVLFAAPIEYDHYGAANPEQGFLQAKAKVKELNPRVGFIRSDVQDTTELYAYIYKSKKIWQEKLLQTPFSFRPKVVGAGFFADQVSELLRTGGKGADVVVRGEKERHYTEVAHNRDIEDWEMEHQVGNIRLLVSRYKGPEDRFGTVVVSK